MSDAFWNEGFNKSCVNVRCHYTFGCVILGTISYSFNRRRGIYRCGIYHLVLLQVVGWGGVSACFATPPHETAKVSTISIFLILIMDCFAITKLPRHHIASQVSELVNVQKWLRFPLRLHLVCACVQGSLRSELNDFFTSRTCLEDTFQFTFAVLNS